MKKILRNLVKRGKQTEIIWRYGYNFSPTITFVSEFDNQLNQVEKNILEKLNEDGIAFSTVDELLNDTKSFQEINLTVNSILKNRKDELIRFKSEANNEGEIGNKTFNLELFGSELTFDVENIFARFALNNNFLNIANSYFQMYAKLRYYNVWKTFASKGNSRESQLWHFDREDKYILKIFLYLSDVDEGSGPFTYAPRTHKKGNLKGVEPDFFLEAGVRRTNDEQMNAVFPKEKWIKGIGTKGTIIFADTRGFHKGGEARTNDRLMFTCMFTSSASESKKLIKYPADLNLESFSKKQLKAIYF